VSKRWRGVQNRDLLTQAGRGRHRGLRHRPGTGRPLRPVDPQPRQAREPANTLLASRWTARSWPWTTASPCALIAPDRPASCRPNGSRVGDPMTAPPLSGAGNGPTSGSARRRRHGHGLGVRGTLAELGSGNPAKLATWVGGLDLLHDLVVAPALVLVGLAVASVLGPRVRGPNPAAMAPHRPGRAVLDSGYHGLGASSHNSSTPAAQLTPTASVVIVAGIWLIALGVVGSPPMAPTGRSAMTGRLARSAASAASRPARRRGARRLCEDLGPGAGSGADGGPRPGGGIPGGP